MRLDTNTILAAALGSVARQMGDQPGAASKSSPKSGDKTETSTAAAKAMAQPRDWVADLYPIAGLAAFTAVVLMGMKYAFGK